MKTRILTTLGCLGMQTLIATAGAISVFAEESTNATRKERNSRVELRTKVQKKETSNHKEDGQTHATLSVSVSGDDDNKGDVVVKQVEEQLNASKLSESARRKVIESLKDQLAAQANQAKDNMRQFHIEFRQNANSGDPIAPAITAVPGASGAAFSFSGNHAPFSTLGQAQKTKLKNAISESLEQSGVSKEVIEKAVNEFEKALETMMPRALTLRSEMKPPYRIGVGCKPKEENDTSIGVEVEKVFDDSVASKAGIEPGDKLLSIDGKDVHTHDDIVAAVQEAGKNDRTVEIKAMRGDVETTYQLKPTQAAIAEFDVNVFGSGRMVPMPPQAWVMPNAPTMPQNAFPQYFPNPMQGGQGMVFAFPWNVPQSSGNANRLENQNEKNIDTLKEELSGLRKEMEELKELLKKSVEK